MNKKKPKIAPFFLAISCMFAKNVQAVSKMKQPEDAIPLEEVPISLVQKSFKGGQRAFLNAQNSHKLALRHWKFLKTIPVEGNGLRKFLAIVTGKGKTLQSLTISLEDPASQNKLKKYLLHAPLGSMLAEYKARSPFSWDISRAKRLRGLKIRPGIDAKQALVEEEKRSLAGKFGLDIRYLHDLNTLSLGINPRHSSVPTDISSAHYSRTANHLLKRLPRLESLELSIDIGANRTLFGDKRGSALLGLLKMQELFAKPLPLKNLALSVWSQRDGFTEVFPPEDISRVAEHLETFSLSLYDEDPTYNNGQAGVQKNQIPAEFVLSLFRGFSKVPNKKINFINTVEFVHNRPYSQHNDLLFEYTPSVIISPIKKHTNDKDREERYGAIFKGLSKLSNIERLEFRGWFQSGFDYGVDFGSSSAPFYIGQKLSELSCKNLEYFRVSDVFAYPFTNVLRHETFDAKKVDIGRLKLDRYSQDFLAQLTSKKKLEDLTFSLESKDFDLFLKYIKGNDSENIWPSLKRLELSLRNISFEDAEYLLHKKAFSKIPEVTLKVDNGGVKQILRITHKKREF